MNKNRKIGLGVMATALALGLVAAPTTMHATENTSVPSLEQNTSEENKASEEKEITTPVITLIKTNDYILEAGSEENTATLYQPVGVVNRLGNAVSAVDKDGNELEVKGEWLSDVIDTNTKGDYIIKFTATDGDGAKTIVTTTIKVVNQADMPTKGVDELTFGGKTIGGSNDNTNDNNTQQVGEKPEIKFADDIVNEIELGKELDLMKGVTAEDKEDGDLTDKITVEGTLNNKVAGTYKIVYNVEDKDGNKSAVVREITVKELEEGEIVGKEPVFEGVDEDLLIALNGEPDYLEGVKATDEEDGDLTDKIDVDASQVDLSKEGEYELIYRVADSDGNLTTAIRKAIVTQVGGLGEESSNPNALPKTGAIAGVSVGGLGIAGIAGAILRRRK